MKIKERIDKILVKKGLADNTTKAQAIIMAGNILVNDKKVEKCGTKFTNDIVIRVLKKKNHPWVSRGGIKLNYAINELKINLNNKICADFGASTGGFCNVLLSKKAKYIYAIDVGRGQLDWKIYKNQRVKVLDNTNVRYLSLEKIDPKINFITCDLSFISLKKALENVVSFKKNSLESIKYII